MATTPVNNIVREVAPKSIFESAIPVLSTAVNYNQGDLIAFDTSAKVLVTATTANSANFLGVARQTVVSGLIKSPYQGTAVDASQGISDMAGPVYGVVAFFNGKVGDSFTPGCAVYLTSDAQTVTVTDPGSNDHIGIYQGRALTGAAGVTVDVLVGARYLGRRKFT
jgi:hypothetical protein